MKFGLMFANTGPFAGAHGVVDLATAAEASGFESLWTVEHVIWPEQYSSRYPYAPSGKMAGTSATPIPDPLVWLSFAAAHTTDIKLATGILLLPERNPLVTAKATATLDVLSGGRLILGVGVGWLQEEFEALGIPFEDRGARTDDHIAAMRALWASDDASHHGTHSTFDNVSSNPKPHHGTIPIVVGGHSKAAARRAGRLGDGFYPAPPSVEELGDLVDIARQTAADEGRDPEAIEVTAPHRGLFGADPVGAAEELAAIGISRAAVPAYLLAKGPVAETAEEMAERLVRPCASV